MVGRSRGHNHEAAREHKERRDWAVACFCGDRASAVSRRGTADIAASYFPFWPFLIGLSGTESEVRPKWVRWLSGPSGLTYAKVCALAWKLLGSRH